MRRPARYKRALPRYARSSQYLFLLLDSEVCVFWFVRVIRHHGDEHVRDARSAYLAQRRELLAVNAIKQQHAAPENRTSVNSLESARSGEMLGIDHHFNVTRVEFFHAALQHDPATVDEHEVRQNVLNLFHLMCCHDNRATAIEVIV